MDSRTKKHRTRKRPKAARAGKPGNIDIVSLKRRKKRRRQLTKLGLFLAFAILGIVTYVKWDDWFPALDGLNRFKSVRSVNNKSFPLSISGGIDYQVSELDERLAILSDAYIYIYDCSGELYAERQHAYANAMMQTADELALIYESGGTHLRVENKKKTIYEKKLENPIIFARICREGRVAVISGSNTYVCKLTVFDSGGKEIYSRECVDRIIDVDFTNGGNGCVMATSYSDQGKLASRLISVSFSSKDDKWTSEEFKSIGLKVHYDGSGYFVIGEDKCAYYNDSGAIEMNYDYPSKLIDWDFSGKNAALLFENVTKRCSSFTTINSGKKTPNEKDFSSSGVKCIRLSGDNVLVMNKEGIKEFGFKGSDERTINSEAYYDRFCIIDDNIFLLGYDRIDRIGYKK